MTSTIDATTSMTPDAVRTEVRAFLEQHWDMGISLRSWLERLADSGWASPTWPRQWFGRGLSNELAAVAFEELNRVQAPGPPTGLGRMVAAPTIIAHGTDEQRAHYVRGILTGEEAWCQLFSEPGAGSDVASLQTRARRDGDEFVVNGQKVWTSGGMATDFGMLLARTNPDAPKHKGITYFALDMDQPGVEVRPLRQMTGQALFCEVFFTDARVPADAVIGDVGEGWAVAVSSLANERVGLGGGAAGGFSLAAPGGRRAREQLDVSVGEFIQSSRAGRSTSLSGGIGAAAAATTTTRSAEALIRLAKARGRSRDALLRQQLAQLYTINQLTRFNGLRAKAAVASGRRPGPEGSLGKLMTARAARASRDVAMAIVGPEGMLAGEAAPEQGTITLQFLSSPASSIAGGSDEIQRNIVGERVLGLPKEPDVSRDVPFSQLMVGTQSPVGGPRAF